MSKHVYLLRAVGLKGEPPVASSAFRWPLKAGKKVTCPDWDPTPRCGSGLHGWVAGEAHDLGGVTADLTNQRWLIFKALAEDVVHLEGKAKAKQGVVVYVAKGTGVEARQRAVNWLERKGKAGPACSWLTREVGDRGTATAGYKGTATAGHRGTATAGDDGTATAGYGGTATAGYGGTATAGDDGTATAGDRGTATAGDEGTATAGYGGTATAGDDGTATAGDRGTATAGDDGTLRIKYFSKERYRWAVAYVGEERILPNTAYKLTSDGAFVPAKED